MTRPVSLPSALAALACLLLGASAVATSVAPDATRLARNGNYPAAAEALEAAHERAPQDAAIVAQLARVALLLGEHEQGVEWAKQAAALAPENADYRILLGDAYAQYVNDVSIFSKLGMAHDIRDAYLKAVALAPDNLDAHGRLARYYRMAPGIAGGSDEEADKQIALLADLAPAKVAIMHARQAYRDKDFAAAEKLLREAVAEADDSSAYLALGRLLAKRERPQEALAVYRKATRDFPDAAAAWYQIGRLAAMGQVDAKLGIQAMQKYLGMTFDWRSNAPLCWAHYRLGQIHARLGQADAARRQYQRAVALNPGFKEALGALAVETSEPKK